MDYGFHAPTMSWPVNGTMMIEPLKANQRRNRSLLWGSNFNQEEILKIADGKYHKNDNPLKNAPHTASLSPR